MKYTFKTEWLAVLIVILGWVAGIYFYAHFPERVITHWNYAGEPNGFSSRAVGALMIPGILTGMYLLFLVLPLLDPKRERYASFAKVYHVVKTVILLVLLSIFIITGLVNLGAPIKVSVAVPLIIGVLFVVLGNYMGKIKQNWFIGFRMPWTLSSENVWNKTHRLGGWCMMAFGLILILTPLLPAVVGMPLFIAGIAGVGIVPMVYSYIIYREELKTKKSI